MNVCKTIKSVPNTAGIYMQVWKNGKFYIGKSKSLKSRYRQYKKRHHNPYAKKLTSKYGQPKFYVIATTDTHENLSDLESHYIDLFFSDHDNINFCRAKETYKEDYVVAATKNRGRIEIWCTNVYTYAPLTFQGWAKAKEFFGVSYSGKIYRGQFVFDKTRKGLYRRWCLIQYDWRCGFNDQDSARRKNGFLFEDRIFASCYEAYKYSLLPVSFSYFQKGLFSSYKDYITKSYGEHRCVTFDSLRFVSAKQAHCYASAEIKVHYHWFLIMFYKAGADTIRKMKLLLGQPRNSAPIGFESVFVRHSKTKPCYSSYLVGHCGLRWYPSLSEAKKYGKTKSHLNFIPQSK